MKMANLSMPQGILGHFGSTDRLAPLRKWATRLRLGGRRFIQQMQIGRMHSVLLSMSDEQLQTLGLDHTDLREYAENLVLSDQDQS